MKKKVLVTGGAGFIGSYICEQLLAHGYQVRVIDNLEHQVHFGKKPDYEFLNHVDFVEKDVSSPQIWAEVLEDVDAIIHEAAAVGVGQSQYQIAHYCNTNVMGTAQMLDYMANNKHKVGKIIVAASMSSYGEGRYINSEKEIVRPSLRSEEDVRKHGWEPKCPKTGSNLIAQPTQETDERVPNSIYASNKMTQEDLIHSFGRAYGIPTVALRYFNVYGPRQSLSNPYTGVLSIFTSRLKNNRSPVIYEDGKQTRDFVHVKDIAKANMLALESENAAGESFNIASGTHRTIYSVAQTMAEVLHKDIGPEVTEKFRKGDVRHCFADIQKAQKTLGYQPSANFENGLEEIANWSETMKAEDKFDEATKELRQRGLV